MPPEHEIYGFFFLQFFDSFRGKVYKIYIPQEINKEWIESETVTITCDYVVT